MSERLDNIVYLQAWIDAEDGLWSWLFGYCNFSPQEEMLRLLTTEERELLREVLTKTREFTRVWSRIESEVPVDYEYDW